MMKYPKIDQIPKMEQSQHALSDQIFLLWAVANRLGLYDAADFIRLYLRQENPTEPPTENDREQ